MFAITEQKANGITQSQDQAQSLYTSSSSAGVKRRGRGHSLQ